MTVRKKFEELVTDTQCLVRNLVKGIERLFKPTDDDYPATGVQPFEGEIPR